MSPVAACLRPEHTNSQCPVQNRLIVSDSRHQKGVRNFRRIVFHSLFKLKGHVTVSSDRSGDKRQRGSARLQEEHVHGSALARLRRSSALFEPKINQRASINDRSFVKISNEYYSNVRTFVAALTSAQLTWSQFCSASTGGNKPNDFAVEHNNGDLKSSLRAMGPNKTLPAVQRYAAASVPLSTIESAFDSIASVPPSSGRHTARSNDGDVQKMVKSLHTARVFSNVPSRHHERFQHVTSPLQSVITQPANRHAEWYSSHQKKMSRKKVYKSVFNWR